MSKHVKITRPLKERVKRWKLDKVLALGKDNLFAKELERRLINSTNKAVAMGYKLDLGDWGKKGNKDVSVCLVGSVAVLAREKGQEHAVQTAAKLLGVPTSVAAAISDGFESMPLGESLEIATHSGELCTIEHSPRKIQRIAQRVGKSMYKRLVKSGRIPAHSC